MKRVILGIALLFSLITMASCERRDMYNENTGVYLRLKIDTLITNYTVRQLPETMRVMIYEEETEQLKGYNFVGPEGGEINVAPGDYDMLVYNFGTETTALRSDGSWNTIEAYTNPVSRFVLANVAVCFSKNKSDKPTRPTRPEGESVVYSPDHLFVARREGLQIPVRVENEVMIVEAEAKSVVESWTLSVRTVKGMQYVRSVSALITGMSGGNRIALNERSTSPVTIYFDMEKEAENGRLTARFETFGKLPEQASVVSVVVTDTSGGQYQYDFDLTEQFENNPAQHLSVETEIDVPEPSQGGGGFRPTVDEWEDINQDIEL